MDAAEQEAKTIETYDATASQWSQMHQGAWEETAAHFSQLLPGGTVLEIGCGGGRDAANLIAQGLTYFGTDASLGMVAEARKAVPAGVFEQLNVYDLAKLKRQFDGFWACAVLLHIPKKRIDEALQAITAVLKPGAIGMITMKDGDREEFEVRDKDGAHEERLFVYWKKDDFSEVLARNGFKVLEYEYRPVSQRTNWHVFFVSKT